MDTTKPKLTTMTYQARGSVVDAADCGSHDASVDVVTWPCGHVAWYQSSPASRAAAKMPCSTCAGRRNVEPRRTD
jgi:hypothetical protein